jgi:RNA polymerase sigma-70 factor (ECF subfamily)
VGSAAIQATHQQEARMDRVLVERAKAGDHEAFSELTRLSVAKLYAIARLILRDSELAEDATQEALVAAWRNLATLRDTDRFDAWMRRLLVHACYREAARSKRRHHVESSVSPLARSGPDPGASLADRDELERGFTRLAPEQRALIVLHYYLGLPMHETGEVLGLPVGTVKSRLSRATQQMRAALDADARLPLIEGRVM